MYTENYVVTPIFATFFTREMDKTKEEKPTRELARRCCSIV